MFFGYYMSAAVMVADEDGPAVPELPGGSPSATAATTPPPPWPACSPRCRPAASPRRHHRRLRLLPPRPGHLGKPARAAGASLVQDLHPNDRGPRGTHHGAIIANGCLYCPDTPAAAGTGPAATRRRTAARRPRPADRRAARTSSASTPARTPTATAGWPAPPSREGPLPPPPSVHDTAPGPARDPRPARTPAGLLHPANHHRRPGVAAKTRQKHDYPSQAWRISYRRRTAAERLNAAIKDTAVNSIDRGWIRLTGVTPLMLWLACLMVVRNQRILTAFQARQKHDTARRARPPQTPPRARRHCNRAALTRPPNPAHGSSRPPAPQRGPSHALSPRAHTPEPENSPATQHQPPKTRENKIRSARPRESQRHM